MSWVRSTSFRNQAQWAALLIAGGALGAAGGWGEPLVIPDDRTVRISVDPRGPDDAGAGAEADRAEVAPPQENQPLGRPGRILGTGRREVDPAAGPDAARGRGGEIARVVVALLAVVGLILLLRAMVRRFGGPLARGGRPSGVLEVLARYPVSRAQQLVLLKLAGRVVLLHQSKTGLTTLSELTDPDEVASLLARVEAAERGGRAGGFQALLGRLAEGRTGGGPDEFPAGFGRQTRLGGKVVVDLTRRPHRRRDWGSAP